MKELLIVLGVIGAAVVALFVLFFTVNPWAKKSANGEVQSKMQEFP